MLQQTESKLASIRNWGCLMLCYVWIVSRLYEVNFNMKEIEELFLMAKTRGIILDNEKPTDGSEGAWYRCWIKDPVAWIKLVAASIGKSPKPVEKFRAMTKRNARFYIVENVSVLKKGRGIHFTAETNGEAYNPDVSIPLSTVKTIRGWEL